MACNRNQLLAFAVLLSVVTFAVGVTIPPNTVAYWAFDEGTGTVSADGTANNNVVTLVGATFKAGISGKALSTYTTGSYGIVHSSTSLSQLQNTISIAVWIYPQYVTNINGRILSKKADWNTNSGFELNYNPYTKRISLIGSGSTVAYADGVTLPRLSWHHVVVVASGTTAKFYLNGTDVTTKSTINAITSNTLALYIGQQGGLNKNFFLGRIDQCYLVTRALTAAEIATLATPPNPYDIPGVIGLWKFDGDTTDSSGNGFSALLVGGPTFGPGRWNQALVVNGANYVNAASSGALSTLAGTLSMSVWVNPNFPATATNQVFGRIISKKLSWDDTSGFELEYNPVNNYVGVVGSGNVVAGFTATLTNGKWYHLVAIISGTTATLYVNNVLVGSQPVSAVVANGLALAIGRISGDAFTLNNYFYGSIDDVRIVNRALTTTEIKTLYTSPYGGPITSMSIAHSISTGPFTVPKFDPSFVDKTQLTGFNTPLGVAAAPDGRIFVWQKSGKVYVIDTQGNRILFADITPLTGDVGDHGLLSFALHPNFPTTNWVYFYYTVWPPAGPNTMETWTYSRIARYKAVGNSIDMNSGQILLGKTQADGIPDCSTTHTVGTLMFGHDGMIYATHGDGARFEFNDFGGDAQCGQLFGDIQNVGVFRSQDLNTLAGKVIRIDPNTGQGLTDNPFYRAGDSLDLPRTKIYALGLRNPFRATVRPPLPGDNGNTVIYATDVGWNTWERLLVITKGDNLGWPCYEGKSPNPVYMPDNTYCGTKITTGTIPGRLRMPLIVWNHGDATLSTPQGISGYAGTGVAFYTGTKYPAAYQNFGTQYLSFFWCDYAANWIKAGFIDANDNLLGFTDFFSVAAPVFMGSHPNAWNSDIHYVSIYTGEIHTLYYESGPDPTCQIAVSNRSPGLAPATVQFWSDDSYDPLDRPLTFSWNFGDGTTSTVPNPKKTYNTAGNFTVTLTVRNSNGKCSLTTKVTTWVASPTVTITSPPDKSLYNAGDNIAPVAVHSPGTTLFWDLQLWHNSHFHPSFEYSNLENPIFQLAEDTIPGSDRYSYRIVCTATDQMKNTAQSTVSLYGRMTTVNGAPIVQLTVQPAIAMRAIMFDASKTVDPDGDLLQFWWTFGDGTPPRTTYAIGTTRHTFRNPGTYSLNLTVWETYGKTTTLIRTVVVEDSRLVGYWAFDENTGTQTNDLTNNGAIGDFEGGATWDTSFDGTSALSINANALGAVKTRNSIYLNTLKTNVTISAWVYPSMATANTWNRIVSKKQFWDGQDGFDLEYNPTAGVVLLGSGNKLCAAWNPLPVNTWTHVAAVAINDVCKIYINGVDLTNAGSSALDPIVPNTLMLTIGRFAGDSTSYWIGKIDKVRVYSMAMTASQVADLFNGKK